VTRGKEKKKIYYRYSGYPGGLKEIRFDQMMEKNPNYIITQAVKRMLPKNKLGDGMIARMFVYEGAEHKNEAQQPIAYKL
jgi:large subunit ribosomal protein L13